MTRSEYQSNHTIKVTVYSSENCYGLDGKLSEFLEDIYEDVPEKYRHRLEFDIEPMEAYRDNVFNIEVFYFKGVHEE